jgi:cobalt-zinc-cadmium efflux system outer membrane protein
MKIARAILLLVVLATRVAVSQSAQQTQATQREENLQDLIEEALSRNPEIGVGLYKMEAARLHEPQAGALMDPELDFKLMEIPGTELSKATYANIELMQVISFPTKLTAQKAIAELLTEHAHHDHMETVLSVIAGLKSMMAMLWFARQSESINDSDKELLTKILRAAETAYTVGKTSQQEVLRTNIELARVSINEARIHEQIASAESKLRALLNRPATVPIGRIQISDQPISLPSIDLLLEYSRANKPMLIHDSLNVLEKQLTVGLMKKEYLPDFKVALEYVRMPVMMENRWSVSAGITLPFAPWTITKTSSKIQEAEAERSMLSSMYTASKNSVESQIRSGYASLQSIEKQVLITRRTILPQLRQSIQLLLTEYETGKTSYMMLLDGYRMYNQMRLDFAMAVMNYQQSLASLERSVGVSDLQFISSFRKENHQ